MSYTVINTNDLLKLSDRIEVLFKDRNVKLILDELEISQTTYYRSIKSGVWKLEHVANIAQYFNVSLDYLVFGTETNNRINELEKELTASQNYIVSLLEKKYETIKQ